MGQVSIRVGLQLWVDLYVRPLPWLSLPSGEPLSDVKNQTVSSSRPILATPSISWQHKQPVRINPSITADCLCILLSVK